MNDPRQLVNYLDRLNRKVGEMARMLADVGHETSEHRRVLNDLVTAYNAGPPASPVQDSPVHPAAPAAVAPAPAPAGASVHQLLPLILAKNPELQAKLAQLKPCASHPTFSLACAACRQGATTQIAGLAGVM